jgi:hypothetical protein
MKELDPSEEMLVEQAMIDDENTLIEVESLRNTYKRVQNLPRYSAPNHILESLVNTSAVKTIEKSRITPLFNFRKISYAAAASLMIAGGATWYMQIGGSETLMVNEATDGSMYQTSEQVSNPWIDNKDILHVNGSGVTADNVPDTVLNKLRPIDGEIITVRPGRQLQLTGAQN